jgi:N-acetylglucosaminyldiphosphoundecaprenol N-acetyl-beta-D-mannosaminyltransferase
MYMMTELCSQQFSLGGIRVDALERRDLIQLVQHARLTKDKILILNHNLHSLYLYESDPTFSAPYRRASWVYIDGLPVVWLGRMVGLPLTAANRITLLDSFDLILGEAAQRGWRIFYLGSTAEVHVKGLAVLQQRHPELIISGRDGFFCKDGPESEKVIAEINRFKADILFVGMGMPTQERWLAKNREKLDASAILTSGGTLDYIAGDKYRPPAWAGKLGLYGIFRMFSDPRRLWRRYLFEPILLLKFLSVRLVRQRLNSGAEGRWRQQGIGEAFTKAGSAEAAD